MSFLSDPSHAFTPPTKCLFPLVVSLYLFHPHALISIAAVILCMYQLAAFLIYAGNIYPIAPLH